MRLATVVSQAPGDSMACLLLPGHGVPAGVGLLYDILSIGQGAEEPVGEIDQLTPLAHDRAQARIEPAVSWLGMGGHGVADSLGRICPHQFDETPHRTVRLARRLTFRGAVSSYRDESNTKQPRRSPWTLGSTSSTTPWR